MARLIDDDDFERQFGQVDAPSGESYWEWNEVKDIPPHRVWTAVEGDDDGIYLLPGVHRVNRIGFVVSEKEWRSKSIEVRWASDTRSNLIRKAASLPVGHPERKALLSKLDKRAAIWMDDGEDEGYLFGIKVPSLRELPRKNAVVYNTTWGGFSLSKKAIALLEAVMGEEVDDWDFRPGEKYGRHHPALIWVVETLGSEANGHVAKLAVEKISGSKYRIDEYDGAESVLTPSQMRWISI